METNILFLAFKSRGGGQPRATGAFSLLLPKKGSFFPSVKVSEIEPAARQAGGGRISNIL